MATIEERANKFALEKHPYSPFCEEYAKMYIEIATEQRAIDIDKACEVYEKELRQMKRILNEVKDGAGELISVGGSLVQFRKAIGE